MRGKPLRHSLPSASVFGSLAEASAFFQAGSLGYSATPEPTRFQGLELRCQGWHVEPLEVEEVRSSFFDDPALFPTGSIAFDCALLMRGIEHEWHGKEDLYCPSSGPGRATRVDHERTKTKTTKSQCHHCFVLSFFVLS